MKLSSRVRVVEVSGERNYLITEQTESFSSQQQGMAAQSDNVVKFCIKQDLQ